MPQETVLICTVGGSHQPIVTSIQAYQPSFVHFLCSDDIGRTKGSYWQVIGEGHVLKSRPDLSAPNLPNIAALTKLGPTQFCIHKIGDVDQLDTCYQAAMEAIAQARRERPEARIVVDYTGGTKSMTAGLVAAALDDEQCEIALVAGIRTNLQATQDGTQEVRPVRVWDTRVRRRIRMAAELLHRYDYAAAEHVLRDALRRFGGTTLVQRLSQAIALCKVFDAWDKFQHEEARRLLEPHQSHFVPWWRAVQVLAGTTTGHGFEYVEDLLLNAERRAHQGRYDDAVGRVYRAVELTAQTWLELKHGIRTDDLDLQRVPEAMRPQLERLRDAQGKVQGGLLKAWDLIAAYPDDSLGKRFADQRSAVMDFLKMRNYSLFAHGTSPVSEMQYQQHVPRMIHFLEEAIAAAIESLQRRRPVKVPQLPTDFLDKE